MKEKFVVNKNLLWYVAEDSDGNGIRSIAGKIDEILAAFTEAGYKIVLPEKEAVKVE